MKFHHCWPPGKKPFSHSWKTHYWPNPEKNSDSYDNKYEPKKGLDQ